MTVSPACAQVPAGEAALPTELILHLSGTHLALLPAVPAVGLVPSALHVKVPVSVNPASHLGTHDAPAAIVLVQVPTLPSVGAVDQSQVLIMHFGLFIVPSTHLPVLRSPPGLLLHLPLAQAPVLQRTLHLTPPAKVPVLAHGGVEPAA